MKSKKFLAGGAVAAFALIGAGVALPASAHAGWHDLDPTFVIEAPVDPATAQGHFDSLVVTDAVDDDHIVPVLDKAPRGLGPQYARVQAEASGYTPGEKYTVRVTARAAGTGKNWGVYTWQRYTATEDGKLHIDLKLYLPANRAHEGEQIVAAPTVYKASDVRQDGRPNKADSSCILQCDRVAPVTRFDDYNSADAMITFSNAQ